MPVGPNKILQASTSASSSIHLLPANGDSAVLDIFVDDNEFELDGSLRSLRFIAAFSKISALLSPIPESKFPLVPNSVHKTDVSEQEKNKKSESKFEDCSVEHQLCLSGYLTAAGEEMKNKPQGDEIATCNDVVSLLSDSGSETSQSEHAASILHPDNNFNGECLEVENTCSSSASNHFQRRSKEMENALTWRERKPFQSSFKNANSKLEDDGRSRTWRQKLSGAMTQLQKYKRGIGNILGCLS